MWGRDCCWRASDIAGIGVVSMRTFVVDDYSRKVYLTIVINI